MVCRFAVKTIAKRFTGEFLERNFARRVRVHLRVFTGYVYPKIIYICIARRTVFFMCDSLARWIPPPSFCISPSLLSWPFFGFKQVSVRRSSPPHIIDSFSKLVVFYFLDIFTLQIYFLIIQINSFRGDLSNISAKTATLPHIPPSSLCISKLLGWSIVLESSFEGLRAVPLFSKLIQICLRYVGPKT